MLTKIWERYIFQEIFKLFLSFLVGFYLLYVLIDYSTHMQEFATSTALPIGKIILYYLFQFIKRADILLPLALLLATIKVLCQLNTHKELLAFQSAGLKAKKLLRPLFVIGSICALANFAIMEYAIPQSLNFIDKFYDAHLRHSYHGKRMEPLQVVQLEDHSKLAYQYYDAAKEAFFDVVWIRSPDDLWKMQYLSAEPDNPRGTRVDHLERLENGAFTKTQSFASTILTELKWKEETPRRGFIPFENRSIRELLTLYRNDPLLSSYEKNEVLSQLLFKCTIPLLSILVILAASPFCLTNERNLTQFRIYGLALFGFVSFIALMDAMVILGENNTLSPFLVILSPFILFFGLSSWKFTKA